MKKNQLFLKKALDKLEDGISRNGIKPAIWHFLVERLLLFALREAVLIRTRGFAPHWNILNQQSIVCMLLLCYGRNGGDLA